MLSWVKAVWHLSFIWFAWLGESHLDNQSQSSHSAGVTVTLKQYLSIQLWYFILIHYFAIDCFLFSIYNFILLFKLPSVTLISSYYCNYLNILQVKSTVINIITIYTILILCPSILLFLEWRFLTLILKKIINDCLSLVLKIIINDFLSCVSLVECRATSEVCHDPLLTELYISALLDSPQVLIAEEEKIIVEETRGNEVVMEEK